MTKVLGQAVNGRVACQARLPGPLSLSFASEGRHLTGSDPSVPRGNAGDLAHNQTVSLLLAGTMWNCPIPLVMTRKSQPRDNRGASWRKRGRSDCESRAPPLLVAGRVCRRARDSVHVWTRLAQGGGKHMLREARQTRKGAYVVAWRSMRFQ